MIWLYLISDWVVVEVKSNNQNERHRHKLYLCRNYTNLHCLSDISKGIFNALKYELSIKWTICDREIKMPFFKAITFLEIAKVFSLNCRISKVNRFVLIFSCPFDAFQFWNDWYGEFYFWIPTNNRESSDAPLFIVQFLLWGTLEWSEIASE